MSHSFASIEPSVLIGVAHAVQDPGGRRDTHLDVFTQLFAGMFHRSIYNPPIPPLTICVIMLLTSPLL